MRHWEYEHPNTGLIKSVFWDIYNIFSTRMRSGGVFHNGSWKECLERYAAGVSLYQLNLIKKSPEWVDAIKEYINLNRITFNSTERAAKIFGVSIEGARVVVDEGLNVRIRCYKNGLSFTTITRHWNDHF